MSTRSRPLLLALALAACEGEDDTRLAFEVAPMMDGGDDRFVVAVLSRCCTIGPLEAASPPAPPDVPAAVLVSLLEPRLSISTWPELDPVPAAWTFRVDPAALEIAVTPDDPLPRRDYVLRLSSLPRPEESDPERPIVFQPGEGWQRLEAGGLGVRFAIQDPPRLQRVDVCPSPGNTDLRLWLTHAVWTDAAVDALLTVSSDGEPVHCLPAGAILPVDASKMLLLRCAQEVDPSLPLEITLDGARLRSAARIAAEPGRAGFVPQDAGLDPDERCYLHEVP